MLQFANEIAERSSEYSDRLTGLEIGLPLDDRRFIAGLLQGFDDAHRNRGRAVAAHYQTGDTIGAIDAAPAVARQVQRERPVSRLNVDTLSHDVKPNSPNTQLAGCVSASTRTGPKAYLLF